MAFVALQVWGAPAAAEEFAFSQAFLDQYCIACHNDQNRTANVSVSSLDPEDVAPDADVWEKVLRKVGAGEMPPANMPRPDQKVADEFSSALEAALDQAALDDPNPGRPAIHRLNRVEYANAVRDLFAIEIDAIEALPADDSGYGFDNIADVLSVSPVLMERYIAAARRISRLAVGATDVPFTQEVWKLPRKNAASMRVQRVSEDLPFASRGGMAVRHYFPVDAEYVVKLDVRLQQWPEDRLYEFRVPMTAGEHSIGATFFASAAREERSTPNRGRGFGGGMSRDGPEEPETANLDIRIDGKRIKLEELTLQGREPQVVALFIEGPYDIQGPGDSASRKLIFSCRPASLEEEEPCAREILSSLARRAYRRPVTNDDVSPLIGVYQAARADAGFETAIQRGLQALLVSPHFLFRVERAPADVGPGEIHRISDLELASRLSFFLWSSIPDEELLRVAEDGRLHEADTLSAQVTRMIADRRSKALVENFAGQWLFLRKVDTVEPDADQFGAFDVNLRAGMRRETELLFEEVLREDRSVLELLTADYTYLNEMLAKHYGIPNIRGPQMRRVELSDPNRHGLLGHASVLTVTSYANRTSVVQRGAWILDTLLGTPPPPPPPNVPALEAVEGSEKLSLRESMELHRTNAICASCHARMDAIGFALENFDAIGRWRDEDHGEPIDASGALPDGAEFDGPQGLRNLLVSEYEEDFVGAATEKLLTYALGRGLEHYDRPVVRSIMREAAQKDYRIRELIAGVVESTPFQMRRNTER